MNEREIGKREIYEFIFGKSEIPSQLLGMWERERDS